MRFFSLHGFQIKYVFRSQKKRGNVHFLSSQRLKFKVDHQTISFIFFAPKNVLKYIFFFIFIKGRIHKALTRYSIFLVYKILKIKCAWYFELLRQMLRYIRRYQSVKKSSIYLINDISFLKSSYNEKLSLCYKYLLLWIYITFMNTEEYICNLSPDLNWKILHYFLWICEASLFSHLYRRQFAM